MDCYPQKGKVKVEPSRDISEGVIHLFARKSHLMYETFKQKGHQNPQHLSLMVFGTLFLLPFNLVSPLSNIKL